METLRDAHDLEGEALSGVAERGVAFRFRFSKVFFWFSVVMFALFLTTAAEALATGRSATAMVLRVGLAVAYLIQIVFHWLRSRQAYVEFQDGVVRVRNGFFWTGWPGADRRFRLGQVEAVKRLDSRLDVQLRKEDNLTVLLRLVEQDERDSLVELLAAAAEEPQAGQPT